MPDAVNIQGDLHVDRYLTNFSLAYIQEARNFIAQRATTVVPVAKSSDKYVIYDRGYFWRDEVAPRPLGGRPMQAGYKLESGNYNCEEYALEHPIDDRQRANTDAPIRLDENATRLLSGKHMIRQDRHWASSFFIPGIWTTQATGVAAAPGQGEFLQFNDATSDPIGVIDKYKDIMAQATGFMPNTIVLGTAVKRILRLHPDIADRIKYTRTGIADDAILASLFEVANVLTPRAVYNAAAEGATDDFQFICDEQGFWLGYIEPTPALDAPTAIATFAWTGLIPGVTNALGGVMERGRDARAHSDWFQMRMSWDMKKVADDLGMYFVDAVSDAAATI